MLSYVNFFILFNDCCMSLQSELLYGSNQRTGGCSTIACCCDIIHNNLTYTFQRIKDWFKLLLKIKSRFGFQVRRIQTRKITKTRVDFHRISITTTDESEHQNLYLPERHFYMILDSCVRQATPPGCFVYKPRRLHHTESCDHAGGHWGVFCRKTKKN